MVVWYVFSTYMIMCLFLKAFLFSVLSHVCTLLTGITALLGLIGLQGNALLEGLRDTIWLWI